MTISRLRSLPGLIIPALALCSAVFAAPLPVADFVRRAEISEAKISEDGRYVSFLTPGKKDFYDINVFDLETKESKKFDLGGDDVMAYEWIDAHRLILTTRNRPEYRFRQQVFDVHEGKITGNLTYKLDKGLFGSADTVLRVISSLRRDPNLFTAWFADIDGGREGLAVISLKLRPHSSAGADNSRYSVKEWIDMPAGEYHGVATDKDGEIRIVALYRDQALQYHHRTSPKDPWRVLPLNPETTAILGFDDNPDYVYLAQFSDEAVSSRLHRYRISTNELGAPLFEDPDYSMSEARLLTQRRSDGKSRTLALAYHRDVFVQRAIDPDFANAQKAINAKLPGRLNLIADCDSELRRFVVASESSREPVRFAIYDRTAGTFQPLPAPAPWINSSEMSVMRPIKFPTRDGLMLEGYLSLPAKPAANGKPPLVVYAHGGPWARDTWGYDETVQLLTSRGYAVFQPNYRGSTGYSKRVSKDDEFDFRKMHDDVTDGVKYLVAQGLVEEKRLAIFGASFGGYLAIAGAAFEPGLYRCAVSFAGVFDWEAMIRQHKADARYNRYNYEYLIKKLGDPAKQQERFEQNSPVRHVAAIKAKVYVIHGKLDRTVDYRQSTKLIAGLEEHKVPHEKLFFDTEFHGFIERENRQKYLEAVEKFLAKNL
jgi:dipeptidyl aminopeptidase/acylaminoacyl peptidase